MIIFSKKTEQVDTFLLTNEKANEILICNSNQINILFRPTQIGEQKFVEKLLSYLLINKNFLDYSSASTFQQIKKCVECFTKRSKDLFCCELNQYKHLQCKKCKQFFPDRTGENNPEFKSYCVICNNPFCSLYLEKTNCQQLKLLKDYEYKLPPLNQKLIEDQIKDKTVLENFKNSKKLITSADIFSYVNKTQLEKKGFAYTIYCGNSMQQSILPPQNYFLGKEIYLKSESPICSYCFYSSLFPRFIIFYTYRYYLSQAKLQKQ